MTDDFAELQRAFHRLVESAAQGRQLAAEVRAPRPPLPAAPARACSPPPPAPEPRPTLSAAQVADEWTKHGGATWIESLRRRDLLSAVRLLPEHVDGTPLYARRGLVEALLDAAKERVRPARMLELLASCWFIDWPPLPAVTARLQNACARVEDRALLPAWLRRYGLDAGAVASAFGAEIRAHGHLAAIDVLALPGSVMRGAWVDRVCGDELPAAVDELDRLLLFADRGEALCVPAAVTEVVRSVVKNAVANPAGGVEECRRLANRCRARVGELFGETASPRWRGLENELRILRTWITSEFLDVIFEHVRPDRAFSHQLDPRRDFWRGYGGWVERLTVYVRGGRDALLAHPEVKRVVDAFEGAVRIGSLNSPTWGHAILVMELRGLQGTAVTVVEGNSNASLRIRAQAVQLPWPRLHYANDVVHGALDERVATAIAHSGEGTWQEGARRALARYGVTETNGGPAALPRPERPVVAAARPPELPPPLEPQRSGPQSGAMPPEAMLSEERRLTKELNKVLSMLSYYGGLPSSHQKELRKQLEDLRSQIDAVKRGDMS
ncbi:MAG: hypothetical protein HYV63_09770 [Candidatus Schekmanbacteria bacterium]|nr:hypothetical protein [Candidatus Schekmanbacteria bacterium]